MGETERSTKIMKTFLVVCALVALSFAKIHVFKPNVDVEAVRAYWTPERMANAVNLDILIIGNSTETNDLACTDGETKMETTPISGLHRATGKQFMSFGGNNYVCSGSVIDDTMYFTAGHCIYNQGFLPGSGDGASNILFIPAYADGDQPSYVGTSYAAGKYIEGSQITGQMMGGDYAVVRTNVPFASELPRLELDCTTSLSSNAIEACGYPQAAPFNGQENWCSNGPVCKFDTQFDPRPFASRARTRLSAATRTATATSRTSSSRRSSPRA